MNEVISTIVANGIWAVLFCGLLVYELRDSRKRETRYTSTIRSLSERLGVVSSVKSDTSEIRLDVKSVKADTEKIRSKSERKRETGGGAVCQTT